MSAILLDDAIIHYEVLGRGRPVIFLHSWVGSWRYWMPTMQFVSSTYRSYAMDLWGFGDSAKLDARYSFEWQIALLDGFVQHMGIGNFSLVGHGLGAILALYYAADRSAVIDQLMVLGYPMGSQAINQRLLSGSPVQLADWLFGKSHETKAYREDSSRTDARAIAASFAQFGQANWRQLALRTQRPSLWVYGQNDSLVNFPGDKETSFLPDTGHLLPFEQSGHYPMLDEPLKFNRLLIDFLSIGPDQDLSELQIKEEWRRRVR